MHGERIADRLDELARVAARLAALVRQDREGNLPALAVARVAVIADDAACRLAGHFAELDELAAATGAKERG